MTQTARPSHQSAAPPKPRYYAAQLLFFPAAALHAALVLPLSVYSLINGPGWLPGLAGSFGHAHEMLFGFALAVVAGFLVNRITRPRLMTLFGLWLAARLTFLLVPDLLVTLLINIAFAVYLAAMAAPQFLGAAKKWRNKIFAPTLIALSLALTLFHLAGFMEGYWVQSMALREAVLLLALLMAFMGGRVIAPAVAGHLQTLGLRLNARVQPRLEAALLISMLLALALAVLPNPTLTGTLLLASAVISLLRMVRWRLWRCRRRPDLLCLGLGYAWLVAGLFLLGGSYLLPHWMSPATAVHAITVGALGTLALTIMARTRLIKARRHPGVIPGLVPAALMLSLATLVRLTGGYSSLFFLNPLLLAALFWSLAFMLLLWIFWRVPAPGAR